MRSYLNAVARRRMIGEDARSPQEIEEASNRAREALIDKLTSFKIGPMKLGLSREDATEFLNSAEDFIRGKAYDSARSGAMSAVPEINNAVSGHVKPMLIASTIVSILIAMLL